MNSYKFIYKKGNFDKISEFVSNFDWISLYENKQVQEVYDDLIFYTSVASNLFIAIVDVSVIKNKTAPWINKELKDLIRRKKNLRYKNQAACLCHEQELIFKAKQNPKLLYKYINNQLVVKETIKALRTNDSDISQDQVEIANKLNKCFQDVFVNYLFNSIQANVTPLYKKGD